MISEAAFSKDFRALWRSLTPTIDGFIRQINIQLYNRDFPPLSRDVEPKRRWYLNELAFDIFAQLVQQLKEKNSQPAWNEILDRSRKAVLTKFADLVSGQFSESLSNVEEDDIRLQVQRLRTKLLVGSDLQALIVRPLFPGCGIVGTCHGDLLIDRTLVEIKSGDRRFRAVDVRQVLVYLALNYAARRYDIHSVAIFNPRTGISFIMEINEFCEYSSGRGASSLLSSIVYAMSSGEISR